MAKSDQIGVRITPNFIVVLISNVNLFHVPCILLWMGITIRIYIGFCVFGVWQSSANGLEPWSATGGLFPPSGNEGGSWKRIYFFYIMYNGWE